MVRLWSTCWCRTSPSPRSPSLRCTPSSGCLWAPGGNSAQTHSSQIKLKRQSQLQIWNFYFIFFFERFSQKQQTDNWEFLHAKLPKRVWGKKQTMKVIYINGTFVFKNNPPHFHTVCPTRPAAQLPSDHHPSCLKPCKTASLLNAGKKILIFFY